MAKKLQEEINRFKQNSYGQYTSSNGWGFITIEKKTLKTWEICNITIEDEQRKNGHGRKLVKYAFKFIKKQGATGVTLFNPQEEAWGFWNKMGWKNAHKRMKI